LNDLKARSICYGLFYCLNRDLPDFQDGTKSNSESLAALQKLKGASQRQFNSIPKADLIKITPNHYIPSIADCFCVNSQLLIFFHRQAIAVEDE